MRIARLSSSLVCVSVAILIGATVARADAVDRDPFFPRSGNRGYDVAHYDARLSYRPTSGRLRARVRIEATAEQRLRRFSLDLNGLTVAWVRVDGERAAFSRGRGKLKVVPADRIPAGQTFAVEVRYQGRPRKVIDPDGSTEGWVRTDDGAVAVGEPVGTAAWLPCNNTLLDKATFTFHLSVPERLKGVANGRLVGVTRGGGRTAFDWRESQPMAPYLAVIDIGRGRLVRDEIGELPSWTLVDPRLERRSRPALSRLPEIVRFESAILGPYPFDALGSIVDVAGLEYALETQTRPIYAFAPDRTLVVHETAHQWFGNSVGLERWPNIWLNEGFATWAEWYYAERHGGRSVRQVFRRLYRIPASNSDFWEPPSGHPGKPRNLFTTSTYIRGGMALEALRIKIGTRGFLEVLRRWATDHRYGTADIREFIALAEEISGRQLDRLFHRWLYRRGKPG